VRVSKIKRLAAMNAIVELRQEKATEDTAKGTANEPDATKLKPIVDRVRHDYLSALAPLPHRIWCQRGLIDLARRAISQRSFFREEEPEKTIQTFNNGVPMKLRRITGLFTLGMALAVTSSILCACATRNKATVETTGTSKMKSPPVRATKESFEQESEVRLDQAKKWALAFFLFGNDHAYQLPKDFKQGKAYAPDLSQSNWEIVSSGDEKSIVNPAQTICSGRGNQGILPMVHSLKSMLLPTGTQKWKFLQMATFWPWRKNAALWPTRPRIETF
jgi:hypothetical protein